MKKNLRKLNLSRETLRTLETPALSHAVGRDAGTKTLIPSCNTYCDITWGCNLPTEGC